MVTKNERTLFMAMFKGDNKNRDFTLVPYHAKYKNSEDIMKEMMNFPFL